MGRAVWRRVTWEKLRRQAEAESFLLDFYLAFCREGGLRGVPGGAWGDLAGRRPAVSHGYISHLQFIKPLIREQNGRRSAFREPHVLVRMRVRRSGLMDMLNPV